MQENFYQQALYVVKEGNENLFITAWDRFIQALSEAAASQLIKGTLIQSQSDSKVFYSFGVWESLEPIKELQNHAEIKKALSDMSALCDKWEPGSYTIRRQHTF